jgi:hypothetical protein
LQAGRVDSGLPIHRYGASAPAQTGRTGADRGSVRPILTLVAMTAYLAA